MTGAGAGPGLRTLLILSAIDLLSSALTAGVVLFVILVGADAGQSGEDSQKGKVGFNLVELTDRAGTLLLDKGLSLEPSKAKPNDLEVGFFSGATEVVRRQYVIPADVKRLAFKPGSGSLTFEFSVQPLVGSSFTLFVNCADPVAGFQIILRGAPEFPQCETGASAKDNFVNLPAGSKLILPAASRLNDLPDPEFQSSAFSRYRLQKAFRLPGVAVWGVME